MQQQQKICKNVNFSTILNKVRIINQFLSRKLMLCNNNKKICKNVNFSTILNKVRIINQFLSRKLMNFIFIPCFPSFKVCKKFNKLSFLYIKN